jgi:hypothetical protein
MAGRHSAGKRSASKVEVLTASAPEGTAPSEVEAKTSAMSGRTRAIIRIAVTVVVLAIVIVAVSLFSGAKHVDTTPAAPVILSSPTSSTVAATTTVSAVASTTVSAGTTGSTSISTGGSTTSTSTSSAPAAGVYGSRIADLASVVPASFAGYDMRSVEKSSDELIIPLQPNSSGPKDTVSLAVVSISDKGSAAKAASFVTGMDKIYPQNVMHAVAGSVTGVFGTDGTRLAAFRFARGRYVVEVTVTALSGSPAELKPEVLRLAALMPASQP